MNDQEPGQLPELPQDLPASPLADPGPPSQTLPAPVTDLLYPFSFASQPANAAIRRTPNFADLLIFIFMLLIGFLAMLGFAAAAVHFHWLGLKNFSQMQSNTRFALGTEAILYGVAIACAVPIFRIAWSKAFLSGLHWNGHTASRLYLRLAGVAVLCNIVAMVGNAVLPFPEHAPIDKMFSTASDAYLLMAFGVTVAPFFEEMIFRGFFLPAVATAWDWASERLNHRMPRPLDAEANPVWSLGAQIFSALVVSAPFALLHAEQVGNAWGPVLLLYCVSLILCAVRLRARSLAASTLVHATYNFLLFAVMFVETGAFRHLDKM